MILGVGIDVLQIPRMQRSIKNEAFLHRVFTQSERDYILSKKNTAQTAAGIFCAKEAVLKVLRKGITEIALTDIEVLHDETGAPYAALHSNISLENKHIFISITHSEDVAAATAILEGVDL